MSYGQKMRKVVLPQAFRVIIPPTGNEFIAMMKDTALVSFLGVTIASAEIFRRSQLVGKADFKNLEAYVAAALVYWGLTAGLHVLPAPARGADRPRLRPGARRAGSREVQKQPAARSGGGVAMTDDSEDVVVRIDGLHKSFGHLEVVKGVDMEVHKGEVVVIFGRSGSGKSTVLRCVNFIEDPTAGLDRGGRHAAGAAGTAPGASASRSGSCGCTSGWSSSSSTCSPT